MTLATIDPARHALPAVPDRVMLRDQLEIWGEVAKLAEHLASTEFVPTAFRNKPAAVTAAILRANELGVSPLQGLAHIHVINGRPGLSAELQRALVLAAGHEIWTEEYTATRVTLCGQRAGRDHVEKITWTMDDAKRAKLDGKDPWRAYPRAMLMARCTGELCRMLFADVVAGMGYTVEELADIDADDALPPGMVAEPAGEITAGDAPKPQTRKAARTGARKAPVRKAAPRRMAPVEEPPLPGEDGYDELTGRDEDPPDVVTRRAQQIAISAGNAGVDHHLVVAAITRGEKTSAKDVTAEEASQVIEALDGIKGGLLQLVDGDPPTIEDAPDGGPDDSGGVLDWTEADWRQFAISRDLNPNALLVRARNVAASIGEEPPQKLADLVGRDVLAEALHSEIIS